VTGLSSGMRDPFIFCCKSGKVLHDIHGRGVWDPSELFPDLETMAACLAQLGSVVLSAREAFTDQDCRIRAEHRERAVTELGQLLGSASEAECVLEVLGWG